MWYQQQGPSGQEFIDCKVNAGCHVIAKSDLCHEKVEVNSRVVTFGDLAVVTFVTGKTMVCQSIKHGMVTELLVVREATEFEIELTQFIRKTRT